jgi:hypothetical protein
VRDFLGWLLCFFWPREQYTGSLVYAETAREACRLFPQPGDQLNDNTSVKVKSLSVRQVSKYLWDVTMEVEPYIPPDGIDIHGLRPYAKANNPKPNRPPQCEPWNR